MKMYKAWLLIAGLIFTTRGFSQAIENTINLYGINFPQEKIHMHFDKGVYLPGETIWFKAYLFEEYLPSARSTNFYAALYDEDGKLIQQQLCPIFNGTTDGHFQIPDSLKTKQLICRAYTTWMLNFDTTFLYTKAIRLINNDAQVSRDKTKTVSLQFFPEGGDMIEGIKNTIAFKASYNNGLPFEISGVIKKQGTGEVVIPIRSVHDGMGKFDIEAAPNEKLYAEWEDDNGVKQQTYLPASRLTGVSLKLAQVKDNLIFNLVNKLPKDSLHVLMYLYQKVFYKSDLAVSLNEPFTATVPLKELPSGIMQVTVFDANWQPVAERVAFINNNEYVLPAVIDTRLINTAKRGKNIIEITVADTIPSNLSLSITDAQLNNEVSGSTIVTDLLLNGDVKGYIHDPAYYFTSNTDATLRSSLDLVMLTHGWRKYKWNDMLEARMPVLKYAPDNYLSIYGQVSKDAMQKKDKDEFVNLIVKTKDSAQDFYTLLPDSTGLLKQTGFIFYDSAKVLYSFNKHKILNKQMAFSTSNYTHDQPAVISRYNNYFLTDTSLAKFRHSTSLLDYHDWETASKKNEKTLVGVVVKGGPWRNWKNNPMYKMDEKYAEYGFRGWDGKGIDVLHDLKVNTDVDIFAYVIEKIPNISYTYKGGVRGLATSPDGREIKLFIDGRKVDGDNVFALNIENIAYIKFINHYTDFDGFYQAICFYSKKGDDWIDRRPKDTDLQQVKMNGYSPIKEFYSPDYSQSNATGTDARTTLLWMPYIITDTRNQKLPVSFYNNDFTKKIKIVLEGFNDEGKLVHIEKIIE
jgi:hypothetical protein